VVCMYVCIYVCVCVLQHESRSAAARPEDFDLCSSSSVLQLLSAVGGEPEGAGLKYDEEVDREHRRRTWRRRLRVGVEQGTPRALWPLTQTMGAIAICCRCPPDRLGANNCVCVCPVLMHLPLRRTGYSGGGAACRNIFKLN